MRRFRRGSALLEAALVLPVVLSLSFGGVEYGYFFYVKHSLAGAAREGCRAAIVAGATNTDVNTAVAAVMTASGLQNASYTVVTSPATVSSATQGSSVTVTVQVSWGSVGVRPLGLISSTKLVQGATVMRKEG